MTAASPTTAVRPGDRAPDSPMAGDAADAYWMGVLVLVRPDGYVGLVADEVANVSKYLDALH